MTNRRDLLKLAALPPAAVLAFAGEKKLPSGLIDAAQAKVTHEPFGDLRIYFTGSTDQVPSMTAGSLELKPGMSPHPPHQHPEEEFMVITQGSGDISVDGKTAKVGPGSMMYCAGGRMHGIVNTGSMPLLFYFYKWKA
jgi:mannose-6-phosphate isomerase-like protein (cupin superfamily)